MQVTVFQSEFDMVESTCAVPGRYAASLMGGGKLWADAFIYDPKSKIINFDQNDLYAFVHDAKMETSPAVRIFLTVTDFAMRVMNSIKRMFGGSYGGSFGYGQVGSAIAMVSAAMFIIVAIMAGIVVVPLAIVAWVVRKKIDGEIAQESSKFTDQILANFDSLAARQLELQA